MIKRIQLILYPFCLFKRVECMDWPKIFSGIREGNKDAGQALYDYFHPYIEKDIKYRCDAIDNESLKSILIQESDSIVNRILLKGIEKISNGELRYDYAFRNYIYKVSRSIFNDEVKKYEKIATIMDKNVSLSEERIIAEEQGKMALNAKSNEPSPEKRLMDRQKSAEVIDIINTKLSNTERFIITKIAEDFSPKEISVFLLESGIASLSEVQIRGKCHEIRKKIKGYMKEEE